MPEAAPDAIPAVVVCEPETGGLRIAALTLLDRTVVAVHRAGFSPIHVMATGPLPELRRTRALSVPLSMVDRVPDSPGMCLMVSTGQWIQAADLKALPLRPSRLLSAEGIPLPSGIVERFAGSIESTLGGLPVVTSAGVGCLVKDREMAATAEAALWRSLSSSSDGLVDKWFNRPVGRVMSKCLIHTPVSPNQVSVMSIVIGVVAGGMFGIGTWNSSVVAAVLFQVSAIVDCVDGDVARAVFKESPMGKWLDIIGDQVVHAAVFAGIAVGLWRAGTAGPMAWLGLSAVVGGLISFAVVIRGMSHRGEANPRLQKMIDAATNRDFSVLVLILACFGRLPWFLWMAAVGSHVFWLMALLIQATAKPPSRKNA